ncbi:MAG: hypothetical protein DRI84_07980 [Bacteroidetes bacterium]|nr:MAG: hypothetical protein DRI84_07980 [Bacteroidota bacterium]
MKALSGIIIISLTVCITVFGQSKSFFEANYLFDIQDYELALNKYEKSKDKKKNVSIKGIIVFQIAECHRNLNDTIITELYNESLILLKKRAPSRTREQKYNTMKRIALCYYYLQNYEEAELLFERCLTIQRDDLDIVILYTGFLKTLGRKEDAERIKERFLEAIELKF